MRALKEATSNTWDTIGNVRKSFNFRFSKREIARLDELVTWYSTHRDDALFFFPATRTEVLRFLVNRALNQIEADARAKADAETAAKPVRKTKSRQRRQKAKVA